MLARAAGAAERMEEVVVTAPRVPGGVEVQAPTAFATVIDTTTAPTTVETLADALDQAAGVQVRRFGGLGDFSTVSIRGSSSGQVQVYLDGVPVSRSENETVNLSDLPLDAVDHVEVYRSTTPLAFAQSGPGGVVNIVTRRPGEEPLTAASATYGSFTTRKVDLAGSGSAGPWEVLAFEHYLGSAGDFEFTNGQGTQQTGDDVTERRKNNGFNLTDLTGRIGWRPAAPVALSLTTDTFYKDEGVPGAGSIQARDTNLLTIRQIGHLDAQLVPQTQIPLQVQGSAWIAYERQQFDDPLGELALVPQDVNQRDLATGAQALVRGALGTQHLPGLFVAVGHETFASNDAFEPAPAPDRTRLRGTVAGEDQMLLLGGRVMVVPGLRWEIFHDEFPGDPNVPATVRAAGTRTQDFFSPHIGLRAEVSPGLVFLGNFGRWSREPNLRELFGDQGVLIGNPSLQPETAINADVGFRWTVPSVGTVVRDAALEYAFFNNTIDDLIALVEQSQNIVRPENISTATIRGNELSARARLWDRFRLTANYTHQDARDTGQDPYHGNRLPGRPADEAYAHIELDWSPEHPLPWLPRLWPGRLFYDVDVIADDFLDRANTRLVSSRVLQGVGVQLALPVPRMQATLEVRNVGDDRTADVFGFPLPGRSVFFTLSWGFGREAAVH